MMESAKERDTADDATSSKRDRIIGEDRDDGHDKEDVRTNYIDDKGTETRDSTRKLPRAITQRIMGEGT